jgi:hypothetical protein
VSTSQFVLALVIAVLGSGGLGTGLTLFFTRRRTVAEVQHTDAQTSGAYVEQVKSLVTSLSSEMDKIGRISEALSGCMTAKADVEIQLKESRAENAHLERTLKTVREENTEQEKTLVALRSKLKAELDV